MYKNQLDTLINQNNLPKSIFLYGEEFYTNSYMKKMLPLITISDNVLSYYYDEYDFVSAKNFISQPSLFGDINLLYIRGDKKIPKKELDVLVDIAFKNDISYFYYEFLGEDKVAKEVTRSFSKKKKGEFVRFFKPNMSESIGLLANQSREIGLEIDSYAIRELLKIQNDNISLCYNELDKLMLINKKVESRDVVEHVYGMGEMVLDDFILKLLAGNDVRDDLKTILESSTSDEIRVINAVTNFITMLLSFHIYIKAHGSYDVKEILGYPLPPFLVKQRAELSIKMNLKTYENILKHLLESEYVLKTEPNIEKNSYLYATLIKLQAIL